MSDGASGFPYLDEGAHYTWEVRRAMLAVFALWPSLVPTGIDFQRVEGEDGGPWVVLRFQGHPGFAIWKRTGAVYRMDANGAVEDDPFLSWEDEYGHPLLEGHAL